MHVPVYISKDAGAGAGSVTLTAKSEGDPSKTVSATCSPVDGSVGGSVPATLSLSLGAAASFGPLTPGLQKDYFATTPANVISTAADALPPTALAPPSPVYDRP